MSLTSANPLRLAMKSAFSKTRAPSLNKNYSIYEFVGAFEFFADNEDGRSEGNERTLETSLCLD